MQLLLALALVAALCMGSGAASDLRGAVRAGVDSSSNNQCTCSLGQAWPKITCGCSKACSNTCCYFSQPGQFDQLLSSCQCQGQTHNIFDTSTTVCGQGTDSAMGSGSGNNYFQSGMGPYAWSSDASSSWYTTSVPYNPACMCGDSPCANANDCDGNNKGRQQQTARKSTGV
jgi:hypothetical protein